MEGAGLMIAPVMVVDDEAMVRKSLAQAIERSGAEVITAADGEEALAKFREITHLDETASCASVIDACIESGLPLSYVGTGRDIPGDLDPVEPRRLICHTLQGAHTS
jgi:CheY-like chemotaxis protein